MFLIGESADAVHHQKPNDGIQTASGGESSDQIINVT